MKFSMHFNIPDNIHEYECAMKGAKFVLADEEFKQILRNVCKYDDVALIREHMQGADKISNEQIVAVVQAIREIYWNNLNNYGARIEGT